MWKKKVDSHDHPTPSTSRRGLSGTKLSPFHSTRRTSGILWGVFTRERRKGERKRSRSYRNLRESSVLWSVKRGSWKGNWFNMAVHQQPLVQNLMNVMMSMSNTMELMSQLRQFLEQQCMTMVTPKS
ncbi:unnamed protein product, partial [Vitis vinifera]